MHSFYATTSLWISRLLEQFYISIMPHNSEKEKEEREEKEEESNTKKALEEDEYFIGASLITVLVNTLRTAEASQTIQHV